MHFFLFVFPSSRNSSELLLLCNETLFYVKWWTIVQCSGQTQHCGVGKGKQLRLNRVKSCEGKKHGGRFTFKKEKNRDFDRREPYSELI